MSLRHKVLEVRLYRCITWDGESPGFDVDAASQLLGRRIVADGPTGSMLEFEFMRGNVYLRPDGSLVTRGFDTYASALVAITLATFEVLTIPTWLPPYNYALALHETPYEASNVKILAVTAVCKFGHFVDIPLFLVRERGNFPAVTVEQDGISFWMTNDDVTTRLRVHPDGRATIVMTEGWGTPFGLTHKVHQSALESEKVLRTYFHNGTGARAINAA